MKKHPSRQDLIRAAKGANQTIKEHLESCFECRDLYELYRRFPLFGSIPLLDAPSVLITEAIAIPKQGSLKEKLKRLSGLLTFDSWLMPMPVGVRGEGTLQERRLRFENENFALDIRAEKQLQGWDFIAQMSFKAHPEESSLICIGQKELAPNDAGFYQWQSKLPTRKIKVKTASSMVEFPEISWKHPRSR